MSILNKLADGLSNFIIDNINYFFIMVALWFILSICSNIFGYLIVVNYF
jgi:hypothetical protein